MLSILVPTYHYNVYPLALELEQQALALGINFEVIFLDDGSFSHFNNENQNINALTNCKFLESKKNYGRTATRQQLAEMAQYSWLLFLDADTFPKDNNFIKRIIDELKSEIDLIFGGIIYEKSKPDNDKILRWHYGTQRESKSVMEREKSPYASIISGSFVIKKDIFIKANKPMVQNTYGLDILFTEQLKQLNTKVIHIDNPVYHLGLESNEDYLIKSKKALETLYKLKKQNVIGSSSTQLLKTYRILKAIGVASAFGKILKTKEQRIEKNLKSESPNLFLFDLYRLGYFCRIKS